MLRLTVSTEEYLMLGDDIKLIFLGGTGKHLRIMLDVPKEINVVRSSVLEKYAADPEARTKLPKYYAQTEHPEKYVKKKSGKEPHIGEENAAGVPKTFVVHKKVGAKG